MRRTIPIRGAMVAVLVAVSAGGCSAPSGAEGYALGFRYVDLVQIAFWIVGAAGVIYAILKGLRELRDGTDTRKADHRWRQASFAMSLIKELQSDPQAKHALDMIDYAGRCFTLPESRDKVRIDYSRMVWGLRVEPLGNPGNPDDKNNLDETDEFIRGAFDALFEHVARMRWAVESRLVEFEDISRVLDYYVDCIGDDFQLQQAVETYMTTFNYKPELEFLNRFKAKSTATS